MQIGEKVQAIHGDLQVRSQSEKRSIDLFQEIVEKKCWTVLVLCKFSELSSDEKELLEKNEEEFSKLGCSFYTCTPDVVNLEGKNISILTSSDISVASGKTVVLVSSEG